MVSDTITEKYRGLNHERIVNQVNVYQISDLRLMFFPFILY